MSQYSLSGLCHFVALADCIRSGYVGGQLVIIRNILSFFFSQLLLAHHPSYTFQYRSVFLFLVFIFHRYCIKPAVCLQTLFPICTSTRTTRGSTTHNMSINRYRSMSGFLSFSSKSALVWNYLPDDLKSCTTIADFRVKLAVWLKDSLTLNHRCDLLLSNVHNQ